MPRLVDLAGLEALEKVDGLHVSRNASLANLSALQGLREVVGLLRVEENAQLTQLGMPILEQTSWLHIIHNPQLTRVELPALQATTELIITLNRSLSSEAAHAFAQGLEITTRAKLDGNLGDPVHVDQCPWESDDECDAEPRFLDNTLSLCPKGTDEEDCKDEDDDEDDDGCRVGSRC